MANLPLHWSCGGLTPTRPLHTLGHHLRVEQCAVLLRSLNCRVLSPAFAMHIRSTESPAAMLPSPLSSGATQVSTPQQCAEVSQNPESLPPLHILTCVQRADLSKLMPTTGTVLVEMLCLPIVASELADIPLQPSSHRREYLPRACLPSRRPF